MRILPFVVFLSAAVSAVAATALFPQPLHLVKRIDDPFAKKAITVDEYCYGNRIVTVSGDRVKIVDYDEQQVTEIDHGNGTYSVTRFDDIARARPQAAAPKAAGKPGETTGKVTPLGMKGSAAGRSVDSFEIEAPKQKLTIGVDRSVTLSRAAVEALIGAAYPNARREEHEQMLSVAASTRPSGGRIAVNSADASYGLPSDQSVTYETEAGAVTMRSSVLRYDADLPPRDAMLIDPGATRVESHLTRLAREMHDADTIPTTPKH